MKSNFHFCCHFNLISSENKIQLVKSRQYSKKLSLIRQSIIKPIKPKEFPDSIVLKEFYTSRKFYKYLGKILDPVPIYKKDKVKRSDSSYSDLGVTPWSRLYKFEEAIQSMTSAQIFNYLSHQKKYVHDSPKAKLKKKLASTKTPQSRNSSKLRSSSSRNSWLLNDSAYRNPKVIITKNLKESLTGINALKTFKNEVK